MLLEQYVNIGQILMVLGPVWSKHAIYFNKHDSSFIFQFIMAYTHGDIQLGNIRQWTKVRRKNNGVVNNDVWLYYYMFQWGLTNMINKIQ